MSTPNLEQQEKKRLEKLSKDRDNKCEPIAEQILQIIASHKPPASITNNERDHQKMLDAYTPIYAEITQLFLRKQVTLSEIEYTMSIVLSFFELTKQLIDRSNRKNLELAQNKLWGKEVLDLTLNDVDDILKSESNK